MVTSSGAWVEIELFFSFGTMAAQFQVKKNV